MADDLRDYGLVPLREVGGLARFARGVPLRRRDGTVRAFAMVDAEDYDWAARFSWSLSPQGYARRREAGGLRWPSLHRELLSLPYERRGASTVDGDHISGDRLDNRRSNLRIATRAQNHQNRHATRGTSQHRGVSWDPARQQWKAQATLNYRNHFIGRFNSEEQAAAAAAAWRQEHMPFSTN